MKIIVASSNKGKLKEFRELFPNIEFISLLDLKYDKDIVENGISFKENAYIKAKTIYDEFKLPTIADDSGISCEALLGAPGIYSKRFSGGDDEDNNRLLLEKMHDKEDKTCYYTCAICLILGDDKIYMIEEKCYGKITEDRRGTNGFGYDPYFYLPSYGKTMAELPLEEKNKISHRGKALSKLKDVLLSYEDRTTL